MEAWTMGLGGSGVRDSFFFKRVKGNIKMLTRVYQSDTITNRFHFLPISQTFYNNHALFFIIRNTHTHRLFRITDILWLFNDYQALNSLCPWSLIYWRNFKHTWSLLNSTPRRYNHTGIRKERRMVWPYLISLHLFTVLLSPALY